MRIISSIIVTVSLLTGDLALTAREPAFVRTIPHPLASHPGNIFLAGEEVTVAVPNEAETWRLLDYEGRILTEKKAGQGRVMLGQLTTGFYRLTSSSATNGLSLAVITPLRVPTPLNSPIAMDVAMSWFYPTEKMEAVANLCALAGVNWVRDRLAWGVMEPKQGQFADKTIYDAAASVQASAGLRVLQVMHQSPSWANPNHKRFPLDLRDGYRFYETMARRWKGQMQAFEPWNEADISMFGGHTGSEMASLQKAAWLGLKAGNPDLIACLNVFAVHNRDQLEDFRENAAWPYFDTFNLHHYEPFDNYPGLYADFRAVSAGKPMWVTECSLPVKWSGDEQLKEPTDADLNVQSERVAKTFATSLHEGTAEIFYFLMPHYVEGKTQFGIVRPDLTPRPAYVALAAAGRLLAAAKPLGRWNTPNDGVRAFLFRAKPEGHAREVLVAWTTKGKASVALPAGVESVSDHLGRAREPETALKLTTAPVFVVLRDGSFSQATLVPPPAPAPLLKGKPSPVVFQALWPEERIVLAKSAYRVVAERTEAIPVFAYNFSRRAAHGTIWVEAPKGWTVQLPSGIDLAPQERKEMALQVFSPGSSTNTTETIRVHGNLGAAGKAELSLRVMTEVH